MLSEPKYKHNVHNPKTGEWLGGSNNWDVARGIIYSARQSARAEGLVAPELRIITFH